MGQSQAICGRSLIPCQDTPCVKMPFLMNISVPAPLTARGSGELVCPVKEDFPEPGKRTFCFKQDIPVMSYLIAFIVTDLESRQIGPRSWVFAEPAIVEAAETE